MSYIENPLSFSDSLSSSSQLPRAECAYVSQPESWNYGFPQQICCHLDFPCFVSASIRNFPSGPPARILGFFSWTNVPGPRSVTAFLLNLVRDFHSQRLVNATRIEGRPSRPWCKNQCAQSPSVA